MMTRSNGYLTPVSNLRRFTLTTMTRQGLTWEPVRARCLHGSLGESSTVLTLAKGQHLTRKPIMGHCRYFLPSSKVDATACVSAWSCPSPCPRIVLPTRNQGLDTEQSLGDHAMPSKKGTTRSTPFATPNIAANEESNAVQPVETVEAALQSPEVTKILAKPTRSMNRSDLDASITELGRHISRGCRLARLEGDEDGGGNIHVNTSVALQSCSDWKGHIEHIRTDEPYPQEVKAEDERADFDTPQSNLAGFFFRAGELAERARNPQPADVPVMPFDYRLGDDDQAVADALDRAAQLVRDEEDADIRRTEADCQAKQNDADYSHITTMSMAMRVSRRFPERIRQDLPNELAHLRDDEKNFELRELMAFCFRAGQLSGWR